MVKWFMVTTDSPANSDTYAQYVTTDVIAIAASPAVSKPTLPQWEWPGLPASGSTFPMSLLH